MKGYGRWAGNRKGTEENKNNCVVEVPGAFIYGHQCLRKRGYGKDKLFCKQHSEMSNVYVPGYQKELK